jgi:hypothetical protein
LSSLSARKKKTAQQANRPLRRSKLELSFGLQWGTTFARPTKILCPEEI